MKNILGLDISLTSFGWFLQDGKKRLKYGSFKTSTKDGYLITRLMMQRDRFVNLINELKVSHIGIEQPLQRTFSSELLYALHQFIMEVCYTRHLNIVYFTPAQIKMFATGNSRAEKGEMVFQTKKTLKLTTEKINEDECDAYWISILAKKFWRLFYKEIHEDNLTQNEKYIFIKSKSKKPGILHKANDAYYIYGG